MKTNNSRTFGETTIGQSPPQKTRRDGLSDARLKNVVRRAVKNTNVPAGLEAKILNLLKQQQQQ